MSHTKLTTFDEISKDLKLEIECFYLVAHEKRTQE
jgi:hypothetical protein